MDGVQTGNRFQQDSLSRAGRPENNRIFSFGDSQIDLLQIEVSGLHMNIL
jgi:hypothetical protein